MTLCKSPFISPRIKYGAGTYEGGTIHRAGLIQRGRFRFLPEWRIENKPKDHSTGYRGGIMALIASISWTLYCVKKDQLWSVPHRPEEDLNQTYNVSSNENKNEYRNNGR